MSDAYAAAGVDTDQADRAVASLVGVLAGIVVLLLVTAVQRLRRSSPPA